MNLAGGVALAMASAIALNWGFFVQHGASNTLPPLALRRPFRSLWLLFSNLRWLLGYAVGMGGWGLYIAALRFAPLSLVQAVSAGGIGVLALLVQRTGRVQFSRRDRFGVAASLGGLALLLVSFAGGYEHGTGSTRQIVVWVVVMVAAGGVAAGPAARVLRPGAGLGAAAGLLYAAGDISTKGAVSGTALFLIPVLLACHLLGFVTLQLSFQRGTALATAGLSTLLNNSLPIVAGVLVFGEQLPGGALGVLRVVAFATVVLASVVLARREQDGFDANMEVAEKAARIA